MNHKTASEISHSMTKPSSFFTLYPSEKRAHTEITSISPATLAGREAQVNTSSSYKLPASSKKDYILSTPQEIDICSHLLHQTPEHIGFDHSLWSTESTKKLIQDKFHLHLPLPIVNDYLQRWGLSPQNSLKCAYEHYPLLVKNWLKEDYYFIMQKAQCEDGEIYWLNHKTLHDFPHRFFQQTDTATTIGMLSSFTNSQQMFYMIYPSELKPSPLLTFCKRLIGESSRKSFIILNQYFKHHQDVLFQEWLEKKHGMVEIHFLPV